MSLPAPYQQWLLALLGHVPDEPRATCDNCPMTSDPAPGRGFDPTLKCCGYQPWLPNFQVGALLSSISPELEEGRRRVRGRIDRREGPLPLGLAAPTLPTLGYRQLMQHGLRGSFGQTQALRCPYLLDQGTGCAIWAHREATCSTWFCKHVRGATGQRFWERLRAFLRSAERAASRWCLLELEFPADALDALVPPGNADSQRLAGPRALDDRLDPAQYSKQWGPWVGREEEFYRRCGQLVAGLDASALLTTGGAALELRLRVLKRSLQLHQSETLPESVSCRSLRVEPVDSQHARLTSYSGYDPLVVPRAVAEELQRLGRRKTDEIIGDVDSALDEESLRKLLDFGVLTP